MQRAVHLRVKSAILMVVAYALVLGLGVTSAQAAGASAKLSSRASHSNVVTNSNCITVKYQGNTVQPGSIITVDGINTPLNIGVDWSCETYFQVYVNADFAYGVNIDSTRSYSCLANCQSGVVPGGFGINYGNYNASPSWYTLHVETGSGLNSASYANNYVVRVLCSSVADCSQSTGNTCIDGSCTGRDAMTTECYKDAQIINKTEVTSSFYANLMYSLSCDAYWTVGTSTVLQKMSIGISRQSAQTYNVSAPFATYQFETPMVGGGYEQSCGSVSGASNCTAFTFASPTRLTHEVFCNQHSSCNGLDPSYQGCGALSQYASAQVTSNMQAVLYNSIDCSSFVTVGQASTSTLMAATIQGQNGPYYNVSTSYSIYSLVTPMVGSQYSTYQACGAVGSSNNCTPYTA